MIAIIRHTVSAYGERWSWNAPGRAAAVWERAALGQCPLTSRRTSRKNRRTRLAFQSDQLQTKHAAYFFSRTASRDRSPNLISRSSSDRHHARKWIAHSNWLGIFNFSRLNFLHVSREWVSANVHLQYTRYVNSLSHAVHDYQYQLNVSLNVPDTYDI